ncbi:hypothetical protein NQ318_014012 [Aromia moschata]|uniref:Uncharacterized protein n=1 Tax=Aromia moschata TaxID=1265417 RepID=A0AAV8Z0S4_9CUCU|nr:hypothetical protein NQ318_014012 [Aromia moschata]
MSAFEFLYRDCQNIINFFTQKKVPGIYTADELFKYITDYYFSDKIALMGLMEPFKMKPHLVDRPGVESTYNFDAAWEKVETGEVPLDVEKVTPEVDVTLIEPLKA